jgi:multiple sugar transport system permease protein
VGPLPVSPRREDRPTPSAGWWSRLIRLEVIADPRRRRRWRDALTGYAFLLPNILGFLAFVLIPVGVIFALSLSNWDIISPRGAIDYVGLDNFRRLFSDRDFWQIGGSHTGYFWNTVVLMAGLPVGIAVSLVLALLLNQRLRGVVFFRTVLFLPTVSSAVALALLWKWIYQPDLGLLNRVLHTIRLDGALAWLLQGLGVRASAPIEWLSNPSLAKPALIIMFVWIAAGGYNCVLYLAGLQNIPGELYEAAEIDGARAWARFRHVTWPLLSPTTFFIVVTALIGGFQAGFTQALLMTRGGPGYATTTMIYHIYEIGFRDFDMGYAAAIAVLLFAMILGLTLVNLRIGQRAVHYE